jgi:hypothetical protein
MHDHRMAPVLYDKMNCRRETSPENFKERDHSENLGVDGKIILE